MGLRKVRDEEEARSLLDDAELIGRPRAAWARSQGVDPRSLNAWRMNLERRSGSPVPGGPVRLVELVPTPTLPAEDTTYRVHCGVFEVELDERFDEDTLRRLLCVVASC